MTILFAVLFFTAIIVEHRLHPYLLRQAHHRHLLRIRLR
jgi:hypothetical protein